MPNDDLTRDSSEVHWYDEERAVISDAVRRGADDYLLSANESVPVVLSR